MNMRTSWVGLALLVVIGLAIPQESRSEHYCNKVFYSHHLNSVPEVKSEGLTTFNLIFTPAYQCGDEWTVRVLRQNYDGQLSEQIVSFEPRELPGPSAPSYQTTFQELISSNDTTHLQLTFECDTLSCAAQHFFITTGDTARHIYGDPRNLPQRKRRVKDPRDTLTLEQLQVVHEMWVDLRDSAHFRIAEEMLGPIPNSAELDTIPGVYRLNLNLDMILKLDSRGIELFPVDPKKFAPEKYKVDSAQKQGYVPKQRQKSTFHDIHLDHVIGETSPGIIATGQPVTFVLRIKNNPGNNWLFTVYGTSMGHFAV